ncbi:hypothetical protein AX17_006873 [Amanita inopinata Kibby_2008]|nr:hypothetical protein AX17_006873 [Amanita inopinata Kibby_2008]
MKTINLIRSPSPGPVWETLKEPEDTPIRSSEDNSLERVSAFEPSNSLRKRKEKDDSHSLNAKRPRFVLAQKKGHSHSAVNRGQGVYDPPSSIQVTQRQNPSPGIMRTRRPLDENATAGPSRLSSTSNERSRYVPNGHTQPNSIISGRRAESSTPPAVGSQTFRQLTFAPAPKHVPKTARKFASRSINNTRPHSISAPTAQTRLVKRTRDEKRRQDSDSDDSSDLEVYSPSLPVSAPAVFTKKPTRKNEKMPLKAEPRLSGSGYTVSRSKHDNLIVRTNSSLSIDKAKQKQGDIIGITSPGRESSSRSSKQPRDIVVISSGDSEPSKGDKPRKQKLTFRPRPPAAEVKPAAVIEILDSDEEMSSAIPMQVAEPMPTTIAQGSMDDFDHLALLASNSPQSKSEPLLPPESSPEASDGLRLEHTSRGYGSNLADTNEHDKSLEQLAPMETEHQEDRPLDTFADKMDVDTDTDLLTSHLASLRPDSPRHRDQPQSSVFAIDETLSPTSLTRHQSSSTLPVLNWSRASPESSARKTFWSPRKRDDLSSGSRTSPRMTSNQVSPLQRRSTSFMQPLPRQAARKRAYTVGHKMHANLSVTVPDPAKKTTFESERAPAGDIDMHGLEDALGFDSPKIGEKKVPNPSSTLPSRKQILPESQVPTQSRESQKVQDISSKSPLSASSSSFPSRPRAYARKSLATSRRKAGSSRKQWPSGISLADAITQASQNNTRAVPSAAYRVGKRTSLTTHGEHDVAAQQNGDIEEAVKTSRLFADMFQNECNISASDNVEDGKKQIQLAADLPTPDGHGVSMRPASPAVGFMDISMTARLDSGIQLMSPQEDIEALGVAKANPEESVGKSDTIFGNGQRNASSNLECTTSALDVIKPIPASALDNSEGTNSNAIEAAESDGLEYIDKPETTMAITVDMDISSAGANVHEGGDQAVTGDVVLNDIWNLPLKKPYPEKNVSMTRLSSPDPADMLSNVNGIPTIPIESSNQVSILDLTRHSSCNCDAETDDYTVMTWHGFRQNPNNFVPKYHLARDLPHSLQDHINHMSEWTRLLPDMRTVFIAAIQENTAMDEPDAPPITVDNAIDDEPAPPWEFHYSNHMWHGGGVPPPDFENLVSCDCVGRCDPRSKTCACVRRQREALGDENMDFLYDNRGRLKEAGYPIFECNDLCGCDDDCRNRVVQHGRTSAIMIKKTEFKGWGVFADQKKIHKGTFVGIYAGELLTEEAGEERGLVYDKFGRTYLFDIDFHHLRKDTPDWQSKYTVDAYRAGNFTRFLNHSCDPNCFLNPCYINEGNIEKPLLAVFTKRDIEPGEELCFSYSGDVSDDDDFQDDSASNDGGDKNGAVYAKCHCGAKNCRGRLFG